jgi:hypothetical protein
MSAAAALALTEAQLEEDAWKPDICWLDQVTLLCTAADEDVTYSCVGHQDVKP